MHRNFFRFAFLILLSTSMFVSNIGRAAETPANQEISNIDKNIRIRVEPLVIGQLVDRVMAPSTIFVDCTNVKTVSVYMEPVDAPYGGKSLAEPKLIGKSTDARHAFPIKWSSVEPYPYVKIFAICAQDEGTIARKRSRAIDIGLGGKRLKLQAVNEDKEQD